NQLPEKEGREYGYHLLEKIRNTPADELKTIKGIYGRFWFLNISSFSYAVEERMREKGLGYHTEHWHFYRGASPVITPELFMYELTHFFKRQIQIISELPLLPKNHKTEDKERI